MQFEESLLIRSFVKIIPGKDRDNVGNTAITTIMRLKGKGGRDITAMGQRCCCWPLPAALVPRLGEETLTCLAVGLCLRSRLSHRRQNSTGDFLDIPPAAYRRCCSLQVRICRVEVPRYTLEWRIGKNGRKNRQQPPRFSRVLSRDGSRLCF